MWRPLVILFLLIQSGIAGWRDWHVLVVADPADGTRVRPGVRVTYLGTNAYLLEASGTALLIDPYFTRISLSTAALDAPMHSSPERITWGMRRLPSHIDGILVTHGHFDHLLDAPEIARRTGAKVFASPTSVHLARAAGVSAANAIPMAYGQRRRIGRAWVTALPASHDRLLRCCVPFPGTLDRTPPKRPGTPAQWVCGEPLAFLIQIGGRRIYVDSGGTPTVLPARSTKPVDLAILGVALADSRDRLAATLQRLHPRYFLPSHQDDFFRPLDQGFVFGSLTDFPAVVRAARKSPTRLVLLDYFQPWTLP